jgi:hypothetical protein
MIAFLPSVSSTKMWAAPVETPSTVVTRAVMPSAAHVERAIAPKASLPRRVQKTTCAPARAAATAWFEPLPPGPIAKAEPAMVSPIKGMRSARNVRSVT